MFHVTVFLNPEAVSMGLLTGPSLKVESFDLDTFSITETLGLVWSICNSYPDEMFCPDKYRPIVEQYRGARHRSLSNSDFVMLQDGDTTRIYKLGDGFASSDPILITDRLAAGFVSVKGQIVHDPDAAHLLQLMGAMDGMVDVESE